jgi:cell fate regulator YaaT (PSP1 superfamily)
MKNVIDVKFRDGGKVYYFDPAGFDIHEGDGVIVETARGIEFADVVAGVHELPDEQVVAPLKSVLRVATPADHEQRDKNRARETEAYTVCCQKVIAHKLDMKLVDVEYAFNGSKIVFYFTADGRVDFRELVRDLASVFKTRIELRQIGVRDEAKMLGGLGSCGRCVCCKTFLADFQPVSIKMAKEQNLSLSPTKISGICGRLMCCLKYEQDCYESMRRQMPRVGREVITPEGLTGTVIENNVITERTRVKVTLNDGSFDMKEYEFRTLSRRGGVSEHNAPAMEPDEPDSESNEPDSESNEPNSDEPVQA